MDASDTAEMERRPRCGVPDEGAKPFVYIGTRWVGVTNLKWYLTSPGPFTQAQMAGVMVQAFSQWEACDIPLTFEETSVQADAHIVVFWNTTPESSGAAAYAWQPPGQGEPLLGTNNGDITFHSGLMWTLSPTPGPGAYDILPVALHEIGHAIGLNHSDQSDVVMNMNIAPRRTLAADDIAGIEWVYAQTTPPGPGAPPAPTGVSATALSTTSIRVSWPLVPGATGYQVGGAPASSGPWAAVGPVLAGDATSYTETGLSPGTTRYYVLQSLNPEGTTDSAVVSATTTADPPPLVAPVVPTDLTATSLWPRPMLMVTWEPVEDAAHYLVSVANAAEGPVTKWYKCDHALGYSEPGWWFEVGVERTRYFTIFAQNAAGNSPISAAVSGTKPSGTPAWS